VSENPERDDLALARHAAEGDPMAINIDDPTRIEGSNVIGGDGKKVGTVDAIYYDNDTDRPEWVSVKTGLFGTSVSLVPLANAEVRGDDLHVPFDKGQLKDAPHHDPGRELSPSDEADLYRHYGIDYTSGTATGHAGDATSTGETTARGDTTTADTGRAGTVGRDTSGPTTDDAMTRSEEQLRVGTEARETGRARLRKHVVTENQQVQVPVSREEVRVEREPITDANRGEATSGPAISEEEHEVTIHEERPVVDKEAVPVERVKLDTETVTEQQQVGGEVRKEEIEVDADDRTRRR
jgi:uncharacterized protein (TIGR02271 family)